MGTKLKKPIPRCPCGHTEFVVKSRVSGAVYTRHYIDGSGEAYNGEMWDTVITHPNKTAHCDRCGRNLGEIIFDDE
ncbi:hypothetical protein [Morganella phage Mecenats66]|nr:hypothetical protein [Morganella phage Mecenats66]